MPRKHILVGRNRVIVHAVPIRTDGLLRVRGYGFHECMLPFDNVFLYTNDSSRGLDSSRVPGFIVLFFKLKLLHHARSSINIIQNSGHFPEF